MRHLPAWFQRHLWSPAESDSPLLQTLSEASLYQYFTGSLLVSPACQPSVLLSSLVLIVPVQIIFYYLCHSWLWAELTWCLAAECHDGARRSHRPQHPETEVGCGPGCSGEVEWGWWGCKSLGKGVDWLGAAVEGCAWGGDGTLSTPPEMKAGAVPRLSVWIGLEDNTLIKHKD